VRAAFTHLTHLDFTDCDFSFEEQPQRGAFSGMLSGSSVENSAGSAGPSDCAKLMRLCWLNAVDAPLATLILRGNKIGSAVRELKQTGVQPSHVAHRTEGSTRSCACIYMRGTTHMCRSA
jgi:hypothetical protein